jgi:hypothetical protein
MEVEIQHLQQDRKMLMQRLLDKSNDDCIIFINIAFQEALSRLKTLESMTNDPL